MKEFRRVIRYAQGLGLKVRLKPYRDGLPGGAYVNEDREIIIYRSEGDSETDLIMLLLHEIGHHLDFIEKGKRDSKQLIIALNKENERKAGDKPIGRSYRKLIRDCEYAAATQMTKIAKALDLKVPMWKIEAEAEVDKYIAREYLKTGNEPPVSKIRTFRQYMRKVKRGEKTNS